MAGADELLPPMKWNAWGDPAAAKPLSESIRSLKVAARTQGVVELGIVVEVAALGHALHRPSLLPVPGFALRLLYGEMAEIVTTGARVMPQSTTVNSQGTAIFSQIAFSF